VPDAIRQVNDRLLRLWQRQKVVRVPPVHRNPAQMIGDPRGFEPPNERTELREIILAQRV
jgi:hypothetical protein